MTYRLKHREQAGEGLRRILAEEVDAAIDSLTCSGPVAADALHAARKSLKKARAIVKLLQPLLGSVAIDANRFLRDVARALSAARDADALNEAFAEFRVRDRTLAADDIQRIEAWLAQQGRAGAVGISGRLRQRATRELKGLRRAIDDWPMDVIEMPVLVAGAEKIYARGLVQLSTARTRSSDEAFHEWRKCVKYHWYHMRLLHHAWPAVIASRARELKLLSDDIGLARDLRRLQQRARAAELWPEGAAIDRKLSRMIDRLERAALRLGRRIYAQPGAEFGRMLSVWLDCWAREPMPVSPTIRAGRNTQEISA